MVLRRPPEHLRANSNDIMVREARMSYGTRHSDVPHPRSLWSCHDLDVIGAAFNVMSYVRVSRPHGPLPGQYGTDPAWRKAMAFAIVDGATRLASIDPPRCRLGRFWKARTLGPTTSGAMAITT